MYLGINKKFYFLGIFLISLLSLIIALYIEYVMGIKPCRLCLYQRIPYLISLFISFLGGLAMLVFLFVIQFFTGNLDTFLDNDLIFPFIVGASVSLIKFEKPIITWKEYWEKHK